MIKAHADAILTRLTSTPHITVYDGEVPNNPALPYVVAWVRVQRTSDSLRGRQTDADVPFQTTTVGLTPESVRIVQDHVHAALADYRLTIPGRSTTRIKHINARPLFTDHDVDPPVLTAVDEWAIRTVPA